MSTELPGSAGTQAAPSGRGDAGTLPGRRRDPGGALAGSQVEPEASPGGAAVLPLVPGTVRRRPPGWRPLPDAVAAAVAVRMLAIPDSAPPYDDEADAGAPPTEATLASTSPQPAGQVPPAGQQAAGQPPDGQPPAGQRAAGQPQDGQPPDGQVAAASSCWPGRFAQVLAETLAGARPPRQIAPWTTDRARRHIQRLGPLLAAGQQPRVRRVVTFRPTADVVEMTVIVGVGPRVRALAVRLERDSPRLASPGRDAQAARWVCTAVEAA